MNGVWTPGGFRVARKARWLGSVAKSAPNTNHLGIPSRRWSDGSSRLRYPPLSCPTRRRRTTAAERRPRKRSRRLLGNRRVRPRCPEVADVGHGHERRSRRGEQTEGDPERRMDADRSGEDAPEREPERIERERAEP